MLLHLKIRNLILIESAEVAFGEGLNIITGETGAGKSALLTALRLILGERSDSSWIGRWGDVASVEAALLSPLIPEELLAPPQKGPLILRRELYRSGKGRVFADDQQISLGTLKKITAKYELIDQSSSAKLRSLDFQRECLDIFSDSFMLSALFAKTFSQETELKNEQEKLVLKKERRDLELRWLEKDLALLDEGNWKEETKLSDEHRLLCHSQDLLEKLGEIQSLLFEGPSPLLFSLKQAASKLESLSRIDPKLEKGASFFRSASVEMEEGGAFLSSYLDRVDTDPAKIAALEVELSKIEEIKRRFGKTQEEISQKRSQIVLEIEELLTLEGRQKALQEEILSLQAKRKGLGEELSALRKKGGLELSTLATKELKDLNLPHAHLSIELIEKEPSSRGNEEVVFSFSANKGKLLEPLSVAPSGGELSRLLLALKIALCEKENFSSIVFDEIDSNVGGRSATILGKKLLELSKKRQVIAVTHFIQVAKEADCHILVYKVETLESAKTKIRKLAPGEKDLEYARMLGTSLTEDQTSSSTSSSSSK